MVEKKYLVEAPKEKDDKEKYIVRAQPAVKPAKKGESKEDGKKSSKDSADKGDNPLTKLKGKVLVDEKDISDSFGDDPKEGADPEQRSFSIDSFLSSEQSSDVDQEEYLLRIRQAPIDELRQRLSDLYSFVRREGELSEQSIYQAQVIQYTLEQRQEAYQQGEYNGGENVTERINQAKEIFDKIMGFYRG